MKKAFTLVELLVVVAILGILMGVILGAFSGAGESARAAKCQSNLRNLGMACQSYAMENGSVPSTWISTVDGDKESEYISPYAGSTEQREYAVTNGLLWLAINRSRECYMCPTHQRYAHEHGLGMDPLWSYAKNPGAVGAIGSATRPDALLLFAELPFAKVTNGAFEQTGNISGEQLDPMLDFQKTNEDSKDTGGNEAIGFNHKQGKNLFAHVCYFDGHVAKLIAPKEGDAIELTSWLCSPTTGNDQGKSDIDISFDGTRYRKVTAE